jgi:flagellar biosynthesis protein FliR
MNLNFNLDAGLIWFLVFIRLISAFAVMPVFGYTGVPTTIKIGLSAVLAFILLPGITFPPGFTIEHLGLYTLVALVVPEVITGILVGLVTHFIFYGIDVAGQIIGMQMGLSIVTVIDPLTETQVSIIAQLQYIFATLLFLVFNGHHFLISGLVQTFSAVPIGGLHLPSSIVPLFVKMSADVFVAGIKIAAPVMAALFLSEAALAIVARIVPQMNIFIVGLPLKIGLGLLAMALSWSMFSRVFEVLWKNFENDWIRFIALLGP